MSKFDTKCPECQTLYTLDSSLSGKTGVCQFCRTPFLMVPVEPSRQSSDGAAQNGSDADNRADDDATNDRANSDDSSPNSSTVSAQNREIGNDSSFSLDPDIQYGYPQARALADNGTATNKKGMTSQAHSNPVPSSSSGKVWQVGDTILGVYEVRAMPNGHPYAEGGVGLVHRVYHREWDIELAVKSPKQNIFQTEIGRQNYERECKTWIDLGLHPNVVTCYLARCIDGIPRLFAELVLDGSLSDWVRSKRLYQGTPEQIHKRILDIAIQFSWGLDYAHRQGLLHLDIKPANVMISGNSVKVTDFGLSRAVAAAVDVGESTDPDISALQWEGMTPGYCSPEQFQSYLMYRTHDKGQVPQLTAKSDMWSWAISILTMYYGRPPCKKGGQTAAKTFELFLKQAPQPDKPVMSADIIELLRQCFQNDPDDRPKSMAEIADRLTEIYGRLFGEGYGRKRPVITASTAESLNNRAASLIDLGELKQAESLFNEVVRMHTWHPQALYNKTLLDWRTGKITDIEATHQVESLTNLKPDDVTSWYALALVQKERGNIEDAHHALQRVLELESQKEHQRQAVTIKNLLPQNARCIERFRICPLDRPFVFLSEDESLILFAATHEIIDIFDTRTGLRYTKFRKNRIGGSPLTDAELLFAQKPIPEKSVEQTNGKTPFDVATDAPTREQSGLLFDMLHADETFSVLSGDTNWELYRGVEPDVFYLRKTHDNATPITFRAVRWNLNEEHFEQLYADNAEASGNAKTPELQETVKPTVLSAVRIVNGIPHVISAKRTTLPPSDTSSNANESPPRPGLLLKTRGRLCGHEGAVLSAHSTLNGLHAVTGGSDKTVRIWELNSRRCVRTFQGGEGYVRSVYVSRNGKFILSVADQSLLKIWDANLLLNEPQRLRTPIMLCLVASSEVVSQNQSELAETCRNAKQAASEGNIQQAIENTEKAKRISGWESIKKNINQWDLIGRFSIRDKVEGALCGNTWSDHGDVVSSVAMSIDGKTAISSGRDPGILVWDLAQGCCVRELAGHSDWVRSVDLTSDGRFAVSAAWDQTIRIWNVEKAEKIRVFQERLKSVCCAAFSPSARSVAVTTAAGQLYLFDSTSGKVTAFWSAHQGSANTLKFSRDGRHILTGGDDGKVFLWDLAERGSHFQTVAELSAPVMALWPTTTLSHVAVASQDGLVRLCRVDEKPDHAPLTWAGHLGAVNSLIMTPDDRWIITGSKDKTIRIWDREQKNAAQTLKLHTGTVTALACDYSATRLLSAGEDATLRSWDIDWGYRFPGWQIEAEQLDDYVQVLVNAHSPKANMSAIRSGVIPTETQLDERLFRAVRAELEFRGFGWIKPETIWNVMIRHTNING